MTESKKTRLLTQEEYDLAKKIWEEVIAFAISKQASPDFCWHTYSILLTGKFGIEKAKAIFEATLGNSLEELLNDPMPKITFASYRACLKKMGKLVKSNG